MSIDYYLEHAATGDGATRDLTSYYTETKAPTGTWFGRGLTGLAGLQDGQTVSEYAVRAVYEDQADPATGQLLGRPRMRSQPTPTGARTPAGRPQKEQRDGVAGFDLTFSPPKSVSALWALAGPELQGRLHAAHRQATEETLRWVEDNVLQSRAGHGGVAHVPVKGMVASMFDHWDSRAGDPQLHTHVVIANRVQRVLDDHWVTLDSYTLHRHVVAISEMYNSVLFDHLADRVGAVAEPRTEVDAEVERVLSEVAVDEQVGAQSAPAQRTELAGVPDRLIEEFSQRSAQIVARTDELVAAYRQETEREPTKREIVRMRQQATLENRPDKTDENGATLPEKMQSWRRRAFLAGIEPAQVVRDAVGHDVTWISPESLTDEIRDRIAHWALTDSSARRTTFTRANVRASAERVLRLVRCKDVDSRTRLVDEVVDQALAQAVSLSPTRSIAPETDDASVSLRGSSVFDHRRHAGVYTTVEVMADEEHLLARTESGTGPRLSDGAVAAFAQWRSEKGYSLSTDQLRAAQETMSSARGLTAIIGPAGTGKTTTMAAITSVWQSEFGPDSVTGLAPSAVAAGVLADEIGIGCDNTAKWLYESVGEGAARRADRVRAREAALSALEASGDQDGRVERLRAQLAEDYAMQANFTMREGQLLILDEASMISTAQLAELSRQAECVGAKILMVGDPAQLESVEAGGFLGHVERNLDHSILTSVWRFENEWERAASLRLRRGDSRVLEQYDEAGRLHGHPDTDPADLAYSAWQDDQASGRSSILIASDNATVAALNERAHVDRVLAGTVDVEQTVTLRQEAIAGVGDVLLARRNDRQIRDSSGQFVTNGTRMAVSSIMPDGAALARVESNGAEILLDADYLAGSVELGYATTAHRSQGVTVDTSHVVAGSGLRRELFYEAMTRGRAANHAYVDLKAEADHSPDQWDLLHAPDPSETPRAVLTPVVENASAERSAHEVRDDELGWTNDVGRLCFEADHLRWASKVTRTKEWITATFPTTVEDHIYSDDQWDSLVKADPALTFHGNADTSQSIADIVQQCTPDPGRSSSLVPEVRPHTDDQHRLWQRLRADIEDQVSARMAVLRRDPPDWFVAVEEQHPDPVQREQMLRDLVVWRAVSQQTNAPTADGKTPPTGSYLRPYWDRLRTSTAEESQPDRDDSPLDTAEPVDRSAVDLQVDHLYDIDWDSLADSIRVESLPDAPPDSEPELATPLPHNRRKPDHELGW